MGRSSGGGSHSSGGFGGGHSSGGFSGRGRSSHSQSSYSSNYSHRQYGSRYYGPRYYGSRRNVYVGRSTSPLSAIIVFIFILAVIILMIVPDFFGSESSVKNTRERTALSGVVSKTDWYDDQIGWVSSPNVLVEGLEDFYKETGIQPYVMFIPYSQQFWKNNQFQSSDATDYLETIYRKKFKDEGHFIFAYFACQNDSKHEMDGEFKYLSGYSADTIMDNEAIQILWGYHQKNYYDTSLSLEAMISNTFSSTGQSIMSKPTNFWDFAKIGIGVVGVVGIGIIIYLIFKNKAKREKEKEEYTKEILDKPLETFGEDTSDLEDKYK